MMDHARDQPHKTKGNKMSKPYNGHKNWNAWNVSLWLNNSEDYYDLMRYCINNSNTRKEAATMVLERLPSKKTPDGAPYTVTNIMLAMRGL